MDKDIIHLQPEADLEEIRRILAGVSSSRAVLVVPRGTVALKNALNLTLLRRWGNSLGKEVVLVSSDGILRKMALQAGLPAYVSARMVPNTIARPRTLPGIGEAKLEGRWRALGPMPKKAWWRELVAGIGFGIILAGLFVAFVLFFIPQARITLILAQEVVEAKFPVRAEVGLEGVEIQANRVPARLVEVPLVASGQVSTVAEKDVPDALAKGTVTFLNRGNEPVTVPLGTIVSTSSGVNVRFRTQEEVSVPAGVGSRVQVEVECLTPGLAGNVPAEAINRVEGALGLQVAVQNTNPTSGGTVKKASFVTEEDKKRLEASLLSRLQQEAASELQKRLPEGEILPLESIRIVPVNLSYDQGVGEEATALSMTVQVRARGMALNNADIRKLAAWHLGKEMRPGFTLREETLSFQLSNIVAVDDKSIELGATAQARSLARVDSAKIKATVSGMKIEAAERKLEQNPAVAKGAQVDVEVFPDWLGRVPWLYFRTQVLLRVE